MGQYVSQMQLAPFHRPLLILLSHDLSQLRGKWKLETEEAVKNVRKETADKIAELESRFTAIQEKLLLLNPILSDFVESYILLQKEVKDFPKIIKKTVARTKKEVCEFCRNLGMHDSCEREQSMSWNFTNTF